MEHIIQFGVNIDEDRIVQTVVDRAASEVMKVIKNDIEKITRAYYGYPSELEKIFEEEVKKVIEANKEVIIKEAIASLAKELTRTKMVKDAVNDLLSVEEVS